MMGISSLSARIRSAGFRAEETGTRGSGFAGTSPVTHFLVKLTSKYKKVLKTQQDCVTLFLVERSFFCEKPVFFATEFLFNRGEQLRAAETVPGMFFTEGENLRGGSGPRVGATRRYRRKKRLCRLGGTA